MKKNNFAKKYVKKIKNQERHTHANISYLDSVPTNVFFKSRYTSKFYKCRCEWCRDNLKIQTKKVMSKFQTDLTDWEMVKNMSDEQVERNALSDPDNQPLTDDQLKQIVQTGINRDSPFATCYMGSFARYATDWCVSIGNEAGYNLFCATYGDRISVDSEEIYPGVVVDYDEEDNVVGIEIYNRKLAPEPEDKIYYSFHDPIPAINQDGDEYVADRITTLSEKDAIGYWRNLHPKFAHLTDAQILDDFIVVNFAYKSLKPINQTTPQV